MSGELFKSMAGTKVLHIPYKARAAARLLIDLAAGRVSMIFDNMPSALPFIKVGHLRALGVTSPRRSPYCPMYPRCRKRE